MQLSASTASPDSNCAAALLFPAAPAAPSTAGGEAPATFGELIAGLTPGHAAAAGKVRGAHASAGGLFGRTRSAETVHPEQDAAASALSGQMSLPAGPAEGILSLGLQSVPEAAPESEPDAADADGVQPSPAGADLGASKEPRSERSVSARAFPGTEPSTRESQSPRTGRDFADSDAQALEGTEGKRGDRPAMSPGTRATMEKDIPQDSDNELEPGRRMRPEGEFTAEELEARPDPLGVAHGRRTREERAGTVEGRPGLHLALGHAWGRRAEGSVAEPREQPQLPTGLTRDGRLPVTPEGATRFNVSSDEVSLNLPVAEGLSPDQPAAGRADAPAREKTFKDGQSANLAELVTVAPEGVSARREGGNNNFLTSEREGDTKRNRLLGTSAANVGSVMAIAETKPLLEPAAPALGELAALVDGIQNSTSDTAAARRLEPVAQVHQAVEAVLSAADRMAAQGRSSVTLQVAVGDEDLGVRVQLKDGEVHTTFRTDSAELRAALASEWQAMTASGGDRAVKFAPAAFTAGEPGGQPGFSGDASSRHPHREAQSGQALHVVTGGRSAAPAVPAAVGQMPQALQGTTHRLLSFA